MSNDLSKGEKSNLVSDLSTHGGVGDCNRAKLPRISSADAMETWANSQKGKKLYIVLIRALGSMPGVYRVDLLNRQIGGGHAVWPIAIQGHYADVGDFAALLSGASNVPMLFTSHSLGQDKLEQLLKQGQLSKDEINTTYKIMHRIEAEELALNGSEIVFTSTIQEIEGQWRLYDGFDPVSEHKLQARIRRNMSCYGRFMPRMANPNDGKFPLLRRRKHLFVIAMDCDTTSSLLETIKAIFESAGKDRAEGTVGFIFSTSLTISDIQSFLISGGLSPISNLSRS
ncbi:Putative sucrose-phosphate synthase [Glycine soja]|uniref:Putative sucrose-phosphate synthase n=1 Tax=Glycine soja TaxID=3848 RepID=A0A0B2PBS5_GLYSO|nr:Putative sucrose-phosphate synthase [Glycine soja]